MSSKAKKKVGGDDIPKPFPCMNCDLWFTTNAARNIHNNKSHKTNIVYSCKKCSFRTNDFKVFRKHRLDECSQKIHECQKCTKSYSTYKKLAKHLRSHFNENFQCSLCDFKTINAGTLHRHKFTQHSSIEHDEFACADCDYTCATKNGIQKHISEIHNYDVNNFASNFGYLNRLYEVPIGVPALNVDDENQKHMSKEHTFNDDDPASNESSEEETNVINDPLCDYIDPTANKIEVHMHKNSTPELSKEIDKSLKCEEQSLEEDNSYPDDAPSDMLTCPLCNYVDIDGVKMERHIREAHGVNMPFSCSKCDFDCFDHVELENHTNQEHGNDTESEQFSCTKCIFVSKSADDLENHMYNVHNRMKDELSCTFCDFKSSYYDELEKHIFDAHMSNTGIEKSSTQTSGNSEIISQLYVEKTKRKYRRGKVQHLQDNSKMRIEGMYNRQGMNWLLNDDYKKKIERVYNRQGLTWLCKMCNEQFRSRGGLTLHKNIKHGDLDCVECDMSFRTLAGLQRHITKTHSSFEEMSCPECHFKCTNLMELNSHMSVHEPQYDFICPECEEVYNDKSKLMTHMMCMNHTASLFSCTECNKKFLTLPALNIHKKEHDSRIFQNLKEDVKTYVAENEVNLENFDQQIYINEAQNINDPSSIHGLKYFDHENIDYQNYEKEPNLVENVDENDEQNIKKKCTNEINVTELNQENSCDEDEMIEDELACPLCDYLDPDANKIAKHMQRNHAEELSREINKSFEDKREGSIEINSIDADKIKNEFEESIETYGNGRLNESSKSPETKAMEVCQDKLNIEMKDEMKTVGLETMEVLYNCSMCEYIGTEQGSEEHSRTHSDEGDKNNKEISKQVKLVAIPYMAGTSISSIKHEANNVHEENADVTSNENDKLKILAFPMKQSTIISEDSNDSGKALIAKTNSASGSIPKEKKIRYKPFRCSECNIGFMKKNRLEEHQAIHLGKNPFSCTKCNANFTKKSSLLAHEARHLEENPYSCIYDGCNYSTNLKTNLNTHYAKHRATEKILERLKKQQKDL